jgi:internalin A
MTAVVMSNEPENAPARGETRYGEMSSLVDFQKETREIIEKARQERASVLDLSRRGLTAIPAAVFQLTGLERLDLYNNRLRAIPPRIAALKQLKKLYLSDNLLTVLPPEIGDLADLEYLSMIENPLVSLPSEVNKLKSLKNIYVDNNDLLAILQYKGWMTQAIALPEAMRLPIKQYLLYFTEFVRQIKGEVIDFEVRSLPNGLEIHIKTEGQEHCKRIAQYMKEYLGFLREGTQQIQQYARDGLDESTRFFVANLKNQIRFLEMQLEHRQVEVQLLDRELKRVNGIIEDKIQATAKIIPFR